MDNVWFNKKTELLFKCMHLLLNLHKGEDMLLNVAQWGAEIIMASVLLHSGGVN